MGTDVENLVFTSKAFYISAAAIPLFFLAFSIYFSKKDIWAKKILLPSFTFFLILSFLITVLDSFLISDITIIDGVKNVVLNHVFYSVYIFYFSLLIIMAFSLLFNTYFELPNDAVEQKKQIKILIIGTLFPFLFGMLFNLMLPIYTYQYIFAGPIFALFLVAAIGYAIRKYNFLNTKVFTVEILILTIWVFILLRTLIAKDSTEQINSLILLLLTVIAGFFLIKNVKKEISQREHIEKLAHDLSAANDRLKELDAQKTEFVSLASHQLRGPLTAIKGYGSMLLEGDFGELSPMIKDAIEKMYKSTNDLVVIVGDYLDVSRIEQGRMQYDFSRFDLKELIQTVTNELRPNVENAHLTIDFDASPAPSYVIHADKGKIKQVIGNIVDNAIKYTPQGGIHIWLSAKQKDKALISISDTGVGIHPDVLPKLFQKFTRAPDASQTNILGTGLGLYVARKMIEAHNGHVWAESTGQGKGSTFFIELDLVDPYAHIPAPESTSTVSPAQNQDQDTGKELTGPANASTGGF
jgi:signal transduction histidine kinase